MMKDKLVKLHHKAAYYRMRKFVIASIVTLSTAVVVAVPVSITLSAKKDTTPPPTLTVEQDNKTDDNH